MIEQNEIVTMLVAIGVLFFVLANRSRLQSLPWRGIILAGFYIMTAAWVVAVLKNCFWGDFLNFTEHLFCTASSLLVGLWCWRAFGRRESPP